MPTLIGAEADARLNRLVTSFPPESGATSPAFRNQMRQQPVYRAVDPACSRVGRTIQTAGTLLSCLCLFLGAAVVAFIPASLEERIFSFLFFGLIPAFGFYGTGFILRHVLVLSCKLCEIVAARCFPRFLILSNSLTNWAGQLVSDLLDACSTIPARFLITIRLLLQRLSCSAHSAYGLVCRLYWRVNKVVLGISCLLIRGTAQFLIRLQTVLVNRQTCGERRALFWRLHDLSRGRELWAVNRTVVLSAAALGLGWFGGSTVYWLLEKRQDVLTDRGGVNAVVERIVSVESNGIPNAKNKRSSATGLGQFLNETWLEMIRDYRPDLSRERTENEILELRRDPKLAREITMRFAERNAAMLRQRGLPVTPGTVYLAHFAGRAGAVAILSAPENADAAFILAGADATGRTKRDKIIKANPFLERFTVADLKSWADRKMRSPSLQSADVLAADVRQ